MDNETKILHYQCVVCGDECNIISNAGDVSTRVEKTRLFSVFLRFVSSSDDEIDSSILSELDSAVHCCDDDGVVFCSTCQTALIEWDKLYEDLYVVIPQKLNRIKCMFYAKILSNSVPEKIDTHAGKNIAGHDGGVNDGHQSLLFVQKIQQVKDQICRQFSPRVTLNKIPDRSNSSGRASKKYDDGFDEDDFEDFHEIHNDYDNDDLMESSEPNDNSFSEPHKRGENNKRGRKPFTPPNTVSKLIGPGKYLYRDKYIFFKTNNKFQCAECSAVISTRGHMVRHIGSVHVKDEVAVKQVNYLGYRLTADDDGFFSCPGCHCQRKKTHIYRHIRQLRKKEQSHPKASEVCVKADLTHRQENIVVVPVKVESDHDPVAAAAVFETDNNPENIEPYSSATEDANFVNKILPRRSRRERRPAAAAVDLADFDDEASSDQEQDRANAGHDDDWEMASEGTVDDYNDVELNSVRCANDVRQDRKRSIVESTEGGESTRKKIRKDVKAYELVSSGPDEWIYADKYKIIFNSEEERYYCQLCCAVHAKRAEVVVHIKEQHIDGKLPKMIAFRQTGPNEYIYRDKYKVTVDNNDDWYCGECGAQRKSRVTMMTHIRRHHIDQRKIPREFRTFDEVAPNEFLYNGKYSFRFDPSQELYLCSLCDYTSAAAKGVLGHIRTNHYTDAEKQQRRAVEVAPGEYLYGGRCKILLENGRYRCTLCNLTRETLHALYPHFRVVHPVGSGEAGEQSQNPTVPQGKTYHAAQKPNAPDGDTTTVPITGARKERKRLTEHDSLRRAIWNGWKIQGNGKWVYKNNWQVMVQNGKYKCLTCDMEEGDRKAAFTHVQSVHAKEVHVVKPSAPVRRDEITELEYEGITYKYDPFENKYTCGLCNRCNVRGGNRRRMIEHIKEKHIDPQKFICDICGQEFESRINFQLHRARHEGPKYACTHCGKRFTADRYLRTHLKIHVGEDAKKHQCEFCGKKFYSLKQLKNHRPSHTGEKPFPCDLCGESFTTTFKRREHRKNFHGGVPQKHGWKPTEGDVVVRPVYSTGEDLTVTAAETDTVAHGLFSITKDGEPA